MVADNVDMSLDEFIKAKKIKPTRGGGRGARGGRGRGGRGRGGRGGTQNRGSRGGQRGGFKSRGQRGGRGFFRPRAAANIARSFGARPQISTGPAKIQITNLDFGVSDADIKELFSEFGSLKMAAIHYNAQGKSMGTASLVYARRGDAIKAIKQYNGVALDGRAMMLNLEGATGGFQNTAPVKRLGRGAVGVRGNRGASRGGTRGKFVPRGGQRGRGGARGRGGQRGRGRGRGGARGRGGKAGQKAKPKTAEELDAELDAYLQTKA